jgi:uncharacterized protein YkwD
MKKIIITMLVALLLAGCSDTTVYIPDEENRLQGGTVVQIPVRPTEETEDRQEEITAPAEPEETEPEMTNSSSITKKPSTSSNKGNSTNKNPSTNSGTISGSAKPQETKPAATEPEGEKQQTTVTIPHVTESASTEPAATEPAPTESTETEPTVTEPAATEPTVTEPPTTEPPVYDIYGYVTGAMEYAMLDRINTYRSEAGVAELAMDEWLCAIASCRSYEVSLVWSHTRPDGRYFATVLDDYGYGSGAAEELLVYALGFADGTAMVDRWIQSDTHRQLLLGEWSTVGIGVYDADGYIYVTCLLVG